MSVYNDLRSLQVLIKSLNKTAHHADLSIINHYKKESVEMKVLANKYEVLDTLGEGATGKVLLVRHSDLDVRYAVKLLDRSLCENSRFIDRFKREAEVLLRFSHPGSVQLRDFGKTEDGLYYMAMDYCQGRVLKKIITEEKTIAPKRSIEIASQLLATLIAAHRLGIIHRDIKPENIMLEKSADGKDVVRVLDFGIAKLAEIESSSMTMEGTSIGTPQYMSPEQASGEPHLDHRVDLYAVGVLMYEMLTGSPPFTGATVLQTLIMHLTQPAPPFAERFALPEFLEPLVMKALQKNREDRYADAAEFRDACRKALQMFTQIGDQGTMAVPIVETPQAATPAPLKVLCLDDSEMILHIMKHILEQKGYEVYTASTSAAVHEYLFGQNVRFLITDVQMPDLPGTKVCKMLKKSIPDLKVVLFSNLPDRDLDKLAIESNADGWISKNTKPQEWLVKIDSFFTSEPSKS